MKTIIIKTQKEFDELPDKFDEYTIIEIMSKELISIKKVRGNSSTVLWGNSSAVLRGNSRAVLRENSSAELWENSSAVLWGNSSAVLRGNSSAELWENSSAELWGNSLVKIYSDSVNIKKACQECVVILQDCSPKLPEGIKHLVRTKTAETSKEDFCKIYSEQIEGEKIILYKSINPENNCDFHTGKIKYEVGKTVECPDWDANKNIECGYGLHLSPTPEEALRYNQGKVLKCEVDIKDFVVYFKNITKVRCKKVKVIEEVKK